MADVGRVVFATDYQSRKQRAWKNGIGVPEQPPRSEELPVTQGELIRLLIGLIPKLRPGQSLIIRHTDDGYDVRIEDVAGEPD